MPVYEYRCERGHKFEALQRMSDDPLASCTECGAPVQRVFHPVAVHFKGSGFYTTDYGRKRSASDSGGDKPDSKEPAGAKSDGGGKESPASSTSSASSSSSSD